LIFIYLIVRGKHHVFFLNNKFEFNLEKIIEAIELFVKFTTNVVQTPNWGQNANVGLRILQKVFMGHKIAFFIQN
jgi:hypothetical protein